MSTTTTGATSIIIRPFDNSDLDDIGRRWKSWQAYLIDYFNLKKISDDAERLIQLRVLGGLELADFIRETYPDETSYKKVVAELDKEFAPLKTTTSNITQYRRLYQFDGESFDKFAARMTKEAIKCAWLKRRVAAALRWQQLRRIQTGLLEQTTKDWHATVSRRSDQTRQARRDVAKRAASWTS